MVPRGKLHVYDAENVRMNVAIISLRYAPGNWQHMIAFYSQLKQRGVNTSFVLANEFVPFVNDEKLQETILYSGYSKRFNGLLNSLLNLFTFPSVAKKVAANNKILFVIWHPLNSYFMFLLKLFNKNLEISLWLHEPYKEDKKKYGDKKYYFYVTEFIQLMSYRYVDNFIFHSKYAFELFKKHIMSKFRRRRYTTYVIPLQFRNIADDLARRYKREYFSYIGNVAYAKGFDIFMEVVKTFPARKFNLTTSSEINIDLTALKNLTVRYAPVLKDGEIAEPLCMSLCTICLYRDSTQSGVIPLSFMCGTPVLVTDLVALEEYLEDKVNCIIVKNIYDTEEIRSGLDYIEQNYEKLRMNCLHTFDNYFNDNNFEQYYQWFIEKT